MIYLELFLAFLQIGAFSFGGGYAAMPLIRDLVVEGKQWLTMAEFADLTTIAEMTPGPIIINSATFVGQKMAGLPGAVVCSLASIFPSMIIVLTLAYFYTKYRDLKLVKSVLGSLRPAVVAMIAAAGLTILLLAFFGTSALNEITELRWIEIALFTVSLFLLRKYKTDPILIIFGTAAAGTLLYMLL